MRYSQNLGLTLPEGPDYFNIGDWNSNMSKLDYAYSMLKETVEKTITLNYPSEAIPEATFSITGGCDTLETYRTNPILSGSWNSDSQSLGTHREIVITDLTSPFDPSRRFAWYIVEDANGRQSIVNSGTQNFGYVFTINGSSPQVIGQLPFTYNYNYESGFDNAIVETNIPIFDTFEHKEAYVTANTDDEALQILAQYSVNRKGTPICTQVDASLIHYDGSQTGLIPNIQGALEQLENNEIEEETIQEYTIDQDTYIEIQSEGHDYIILHFGEDVYDINFYMLGTQGQNHITWEKRIPIWHPNSTFELSFLNGDCVWIEY